MIHVERVDIFRKFLFNIYAIIMVLEKLCSLPIKYITLEAVVCDTNIISTKDNHSN